MENETITISKAVYELLLADSKLLNKLLAAGVDNWEGYDYACDIDIEE